MDEMVDDRIFTESGYWVKIKRPKDAERVAFSGGGEVLPDFGPTLRDQFALAALTGFLAQGTYNYGEMARHAYECADEFMIERERVK